MIFQFRIPDKSDNREIDVDLEDHENYLMKFKNKIFDKIRNQIQEHISNDPDVIKGRKKTVQVSLFFICGNVLS